MGNEPKEVITVQIKRVIICDSIIDTLKIDLRHINYGKNLENSQYNDKKRSDFSIQEVVAIVSKFHKINFDRMGEDETHYYYTIDWKDDDKKIYKIVMCHEKQQRNILGVITIFRIKGRD